MTDLMNELAETKGFLNLLLDNINAAVLLADESLRIYQVNRSFLTQLSEGGTDIAGKGLGKVMGCIHTIEEQAACGETTHCPTCVIRKTLQQVLRTRGAAEGIKFQKRFHIRNRSERRIFEFSARYLSYQSRGMILVIFYDITEIEMQRRALEQKQRQIEMDLDAAAGIQRRLLPEGFPEIPGLDFAWRFEPCEKVGGDIFNMLYLDDQTIAVYMIDVCGHGMPAAFLAVAVSQFLRNRDALAARQAGVISPEKVLFRLNKAFTFERFDSYFTMVYGIIDLATATYTYSCAGHPPAVLLHCGGRLSELEGCGPAIGVNEDAVYQAARIPLTAGDQILLFTDGIPENQNAAGDLFGRKRFFDILRAHCRLGIRRTVDAAFDAARGFSGNAAPPDDLSLLGIAYSGK